MKHVAFLLILALLVGCVQQTILTEDEGLPQEPETTPIDQDVAEDPEEDVLLQSEAAGVEPASPEFDDRIGELIDKGKAQKRNYFYRIHDVSLHAGEFQVWALEEKMFIIPPNGYVKNFVNRVYVDRETRSATGYCRDVHGLRCDEFGPFTLSFEEWNLPMPHDWLESMDGGVYFADSTFDKRPVSVVEETRDNTTYMVWLDRFYGIPLRVLKGEEQVLLAYTDLAWGRAKPSIVEPQLGRAEYLG